jgi:hypothetical protein
MGGIPGLSSGLSFGSGISLASILSEPEMVGNSMALEGKNTS